MSLPLGALPVTTVWVMFLYLSLTRLGRCQKLPAYVSIDRRRRIALRNRKNASVCQARLARKIQKLPRFEAEPHVGLSGCHVVVRMARVVNHQQFSARTQQ